MWRVSERIDCIDLEGLALRASLASQADLLPFDAGDLSAWIVANTASALPLNSPRLACVHKTACVAGWLRLQNGQEIAISTRPGAGVCCDNVVNSRIVA